MQLQPYPSYKDSGMPGLGEVPEDWAIRRQRNLVELRVSNIDKLTNDGETPVRVCNYVDVYKNERIISRIPFMRATASADEIERFRLHQGDVIITKDSEAWNDIGVPALVEYTAPDLVCGYHLALLRPRNSAIRGEYLLRALQSQGVASQCHVSATGVTRYGLSNDAIKSIVIPVPSEPEQVAIIRLLDYIDRRIARYIRAKRQLIALLDEQKQATIHRAVTQGLDSRVCLTPSGVNWLGDVPGHWKVKRVKNVSKVLRGKFTHRPRNDPSLYDGPYPFLQTGDVARAAKLITSYKQTLNEKGLAVSKVFPRGTLAMTIAANIGDVAILDFDACFPDSVVGFVPRPEIDRDFLFYVFRGMKAELLMEAPVNTQGNLNVERISSRALPVPPPQEQKQIVRFIEDQMQQLDKAVAVARRGVSLVREYRARLIADVVTGKLDVREAAAKLHEESGESDMVEVLEGEDAEDEAAVVEVGA